MLALFLAPVLAASPVSTALLDIVDSEHDHPYGAKLRAELADVLGMRGEVALQASAVTKSLITEATELGAHCDVDTDPCLLDHAALLGVDQVLAAHVGKDDTVALRLAVVGDTTIKRAFVVVPHSTAALAGTDSATQPSGRRAVALTELREAALQLVAPSALGTLSIDVPPGTIVKLDSDVRGTGPISSIVGQAPGDHLVEVEFPNGSRAARRILVAARTHQRVVLMPPTMLSQTLSWGGAATAGAGAIFGGVAVALGGYVLVERSAISDAERQYTLTERDGDLNDPDLRGDVIRHQLNAASVDVFILPCAIAAGALGLLGGAAWGAGLGLSELDGVVTTETR